MISAFCKNFLIMQLSFFIPLSLYALTRPPALELPLERAMAIAIKRNYRLQLTTLHYKQRQAETRRGLALFFPVVDMNLAVGTTRDRATLPGDKTPPRLPREHNTYRLKSTVTAPLFSGFRTLTAYRELQLAEEIADYQKREEVSDLRHALVELYFGIQLATMKQTAIKKIIINLKARLVEIEKRARAGAATSLDALQARFSLEEQTPNITTLSAEISEKTLKLSNMLRFSPQQRYTFHDRLDETARMLGQIPVTKIDEAMTLALRKNPTLKRLRSEYQREQARIKSEKGSQLPQVILVLNAGINANRLDQIGLNESIVYGGELQVSVPLFSGFSSLATVKIHHARLQQLALSQDQQRQTLLVKLMNAYEGMRIAEERIATSKTQIHLATQTVKKTEGLHRNGRITMREVLASYADKTKAQTNLFQAQYDKIIALSNIKRISEGRL